MIAAEWAAFTKGNSPIEVWQNKIRHLRRFLKGWAKNQSGKYKVEKAKLLRVINDLAIKAENALLNVSERETLRKAQDRISSLR